MRPLTILAAAAALVAAGAASAAAQTPAAGDPDHSQDRSIVVTGEASVEAPPDFARVTLGVTTTGKDAGQAMAANARATGDLIAALKGEGVTAADIQTSSLSIAPNYATPSPGSTAAPTIVGYSVGNMVTVTVRDLARLGPLLDKAVAGGANAMDGVVFGEDNVSALLDKARPLAVADARRKAEIYAAAAGARIGRLMELSEQAGSRPGPLPRVYAAAAKAVPMPIEAGQDRLTVTVTTRWALTD